MKTLIPYSLLAASGLALGAETAYTTPVGYVGLGDNTAGQSAIKASTDVSISIPLNRSTEYAGAIASTTSTTITVSGNPAWGENLWTPIGGGSPYLVTINTGNENGFIGLITSHTADTLTVAAITGGNLLSPNVITGDKIQINKAWTLASMFPPGSVPNGTRLLVYSGADSGINIAPSVTYTRGSTAWTVGTTNSDNVILYPGESFIMRAGSTPVATLSVSGEVPIAKSRAYIDKFAAVGTGQDTRLSYFSPVDEILGLSGLNLVGLNSGDRILAFNNNLSGINKAPSEQLIWNATTSKWTIGTTDVTNTYTLKAGQGYVFRRAASAPVGSIDWKDLPSYLPFP